MEEVTLQSEENERDINIEGVKDFLRGLEILLADKSFPEENIRTDQFIEAMHAWLTDVNGSNNFFEEPNDKFITWADLYTLIRASAIYE
jgi:hypothetical protein